MASMRQDVESTVLVNHECARARFRRDRAPSTRSLCGRPIKHALVDAFSFRLLLLFHICPFECEPNKVLGGGLFLFVVSGFDALKTLALLFAQHRVFFEVTHISRAAQIWHERRWLSEYRRPIHAVEKRMLDKVLAPVSRAEPVLRIAKKRSDEVLCRPGQVCLGRKLKRFLPVKNLFARRKCVLGIKRRISNQHFKDNNAKGPIITFAPISALQQHLGCNVVRGADRRKCHFSRVSLPGSKLVPIRRVGIRNPSTAGASVSRVLACYGGSIQRLSLIAFAETKVREFDVSVLVYEEIVRLDVAMNVPNRVNRIDGHDHLCNVKARISLWQCIANDQQAHKVAPRQVLHH
mmetsp:Transcript_2950/g.8125  ORF Transcript_2950/g.8125 Transcript_2950/m.8125 type:complete len:350 (+) Transcript_2950:682-1731(+)